MGYSEVPCRLCGVSFNIGRIRRPEDPPAQGWTATGDGKGFVGDIKRTRRQAENGCLLAQRTTEIPRVGSNSRYQGTSEEEKDDEEDDEEDLDFVDQDSEQTDEEYEFESDDDVVGDEESCESVDDFDGAESRERFQTRPWFSYFAGEDHSNRFKSEPEHVAGADCLDERGYNGHLISAEEMRACNTFQCLVRKERHWEPEIDDQEFERRSDWFLSGISDHMPSADTNSPSVIPARHGLQKANAAAILWEPDTAKPMPFHTACFDIFTRLSRLHFGDVDVNGLMGWQTLEGSYEGFCKFPYHPDVDSSSSQWWQHNRGMEYLATNPIFVPRLPSIMRSAIQSDPTFSVHDGAFAIPVDSRDGPPTQTDTFDKLPEELRLDIVSYLGSKDIANLRLATRPFRQLPILVWHRLLRDEMPWLWEVWSDENPYLWTFISASAIKAEETAKKEIEEEMILYRNVIREEMPEMLDDWVGAEQKFLSQRPDPFVEAQVKGLESLVCTLPTENTNWYQLYTDITRHWHELKGLQNRRRIWKDVEEIIRRIKEYREEGKIVD